ncbi:TIGR02281 family clan AA aspartic protease [Parvularcula sp. ZS-1/3]|uniref:TIGR02281 family clan AA aspartic protease n=1 Tax=Parvularcula mediterranea TaxID=2732508 RepID=A0A7Y3RKR1_9PROT|nr:TIGR02281 family clan AA aspartic protease [Parvularcula mediterranea]NNU15872.1 TIGR02281 family clan AA aspartic protease [Parvularcula mediterranea]
MQNNGFIAVGTLAVVVLFFGLRGFDDDGRYNPLREPEPLRVEMMDGAPSEIIISARRDGHFMLDGRINGRPTRMMVDTGASIVTLRESDARKAGIQPSERDYRIPFQTANGEVLGAPATLPALEIDELILRDLAVVVLPDDKLSTSLFGVNGLNRFERRETTRDKLILYTN